MTEPSLPDWADNLSDEAREHLRGELEADELCVCGHLDACHDAEGRCRHNRSGEFFGTQHECYAYCPIQQ